MKDTIIPFMSKSCLVMGDFNIQNTETRLQDVMTHRCQPLQFLRISGQNYSVTVNSLLVTDFRLLPAWKHSPFKYYCDHLDT